MMKQFFALFAVFAFLLTPGNGQIFQRFITTEQTQLTVGVPTQYTFQFCANYSTPVIYEALVLSPQSYPNATVPVQISFTISNSAGHIVCTAPKANSVASCQFATTGPASGLLTIQVGAIFDDEYLLSANVQAVGYSLSEELPEHELKLQESRENNDKDTIQLKFKPLYGIPVIALQTLYETTLGPLTVEQGNVTRVEFMFCTPQPFGYYFVVTGRDVTTELRSLWCSAFQSLYACEVQPFAQDDTTAQTQIIGTPSTILAGIPYSLLFIGRGYSPSSTLNYFSIYGKVGSSGY